MTRLSVNVNKLATLRNSRGRDEPDIVALSAKILSYGAHGITVHPRPDQRHIRPGDVRDLRRLVHAPAEFNVEGNPEAEFMALIRETRPEQATLVPDSPTQLTSNAGWNLEAGEAELVPILAELKSLGVRSSLFVDPAEFTSYQQEALRRLKPDRIELYTERFAATFGTPDADRVLRDYALTAEFAFEHGIGVNAGHDLNQKNLSAFVTGVPHVDEVSIGHALICEALEQGLETTVRNYVRQLETARA